jgi:lipopolysaccharide transport system permease protein
MVAGLVRGAWLYRGFIVGSMRREFQSRYRNSLLGAAWTVLQPLSMVLIYTVVFSQVMGNRLPGSSSAYAYGIFVCAGLLAWGYFSEIVGRGQTIFIDNANLIKKLSFPRICLPLIAVLNSSVNFAIIFGLFTAFLLATGNFPGLAFAAIVPLLAIQVALAIGLGVVLGVLNVFFRDVGHFFGIVLQFWFWFTPIVYPLDVLPAWAQRVVAWNPMTGLIVGWQQVLVYGRWPQWATLVPAAILAIALCAFAMSLFAKRAGEMVDEL